MILVVTVGMPGSGKDELVEVARGIGLATLKMGDLVRDETRRRGLALSNANVGRIASEEREKHGPAVWAQRALPKLTETRMLVDGCRSDTEVTVFRHHFGDLFVLGIYSSPETRYQRLERRGRKDDGAEVGYRKRVRPRGRPDRQRRIARRVPPHGPCDPREDPRSRERPLIRALTARRTAVRSSSLGPRDRTVRGR
jgi:dephospho-CoA kinase